MMTADLPESGSLRSADGASAGVRPHPEAAATRFESILFEQPGAGSGVGEPEYYRQQQQAWFVDAVAIYPMRCAR